MITPTPEELELLTSIVECTRDRLGAAACSLAFLDGDQLVFLTAVGAGAQHVIGMRIPLGHGLAGWVVVSGQSIAVADVHRDQRFDRESAEQTGYLPTSILAVPLEGEDGTIGALEVLDRTTGPRDMEVAGAAARQATLIAQLAQARAELTPSSTAPELAELFALLPRLAERHPADRRLAVRLLRALLDDQEEPTMAHG